VGREGVGRKKGRDVRIGGGDSAMVVGG